MTSQQDIEDRKTRARAWFESLRDQICAAFEKLEDDAPSSLYPGAAARSGRNRWRLTAVRRTITPVLMGWTAPAPGIDVP